MPYPRNLSKLIQGTKKSILLLGPRQTGKSTLIQQLDPDITINLADEREYLRFSRSPSELFDRIGKKRSTSVFIDEVQRLPSLLNSVQALIDDSRGTLRFFLTGSSARKLRRGQANLLPGRVLSLRLGPLVASEMSYDLDISKSLAFGTLPGIVSSKNRFDKEQTLISYAATYLKEEIQAESLTRNMEGFSRFLQVVSSRATEFLDVSKFANQAGINRESARRYFEILEDTLIVETLRPFSGSDRKRLVQHPRYFIFDNGVLNGLLEGFTPTADRRGRLFENFLLSQLLSSARSRAKPIEVFSYRTEHGAEVDFIVKFANKVWAIEAKATEGIHRSDLSGLESFSEFYKRPHTPVVAVTGPIEKSVHGVAVLPWQILLRRMGL